MRRISNLAPAAFAAALLACGDSGGPTAPPPVADIVQSVEIDAPEGAVEVGVAFSLPVAPRDANRILVPGARVVWTSLDPAVATVDSTGRVQPLAPGSARIVAAIGGVADTVTVRAVAPLDFVALEAAWSHICGLTRDGVAYCWGSNAGGRLGDGTTDQRDRPVLVAGGHRFASISAGWSHTCGVTIANEAYCWGTNTHGQLGNGSLEASNFPIRVSGPHVWRSISAGGYGTCGITPDDEMFCWGSGFNQ